MKQTVIAIILSLVSMYASASVRSDCKLLRSNYQDLQPQLPIQSDLMTHLVGIEAYYTKATNVCNSTATLTIDMDAFISASAKMNKQVTAKQLTEYFSSEQGKAKFLESVRNKFQGKIQSHQFPSTQKGFVYREIYSFSGLNYEKLTLEHQF